MAARRSSTRFPGLGLPMRLLAVVAALGLLAAACGDSDDDDADTTEAPEETAAPTEDTEAPTDDTEAPPDDTEAPTDDADGDQPFAGESINFWSTETEPARLEITQGIIDRFTETTGIAVDLVVTEEDNLPQQMLVNVASGTLPDVVFHPVDFTVGWANQGLLDIEAANQVIEDLDPSTFSAGALGLATVGGQVAAVPSDGWGQLLIYRKDLFDAAGLEAPTTFEAIEAAAEALNDPGNNFFGITAATDASAVFTQQTFEHFALANNCQLATENGEVALNSAECVEAIEFYANLMSNYAPAGIQDVESTRSTYFAGQAAMIVWSPFILDEMANLRDSAPPTCDECGDNPEFLAENSAIVPAFAGPSGDPAQYGQISYMGIGSGSNVGPAQEFIKFWLTDGYLDWLSTSPEGKFPMRRGTPDDPEAFLEGWKTLSTGVDREGELAAIYGDEVIDTLIGGTENFQRWGFVQGQGSLVTAMYQALHVPLAVSDVIDGGLSAESAAEEIADRAIEEQELIAENEG